MECKKQVECKGMQASHKCMSDNELVFAFRNASGMQHLFAFHFVPLSTNGMQGQLLGNAATDSHTWQIKFPIAFIYVCILSRS